MFYVSLHFRPTSPRVHHFIIIIQSACCILLSKFCNIRLFLLPINSIDAICWRWAGTANLRCLSCYLTRYGIQKYQQALRYLNWCEATGTATAAINNIVAQCYNNMAACELKLDKNRNAVEACDKLLEIDPKNVKGLYRFASVCYWQDF